MELAIITRCTKTTNLQKIKASITSSIGSYDIKWHVIIDTSHIGLLNRDELTCLCEDWIYTKLVSCSKKYTHFAYINSIIQGYNANDSTWVYILDEDTILHPEFSQVLDILKHTDKDIVIFDQEVGGRDWTRVDIRVAAEENLCTQKINIGQYIVRGSKACTVQYNLGDECADGRYIQDFIKLYPDSYTLINKQYSYYKIITDQSAKGLPRVICLDGDISKLDYPVYSKYESTDLEIISICEDELLSNFQKWDPDAIVSMNGVWQDKKKMTKSSFNIRRRWLHNPDNSRNIYECANNFILTNDPTLISVFTPTYKTKESLLRAYESLLNQTHSNWEWVIVRDSTDLETDSIIEICTRDSRVRVYTVDPLSRGRIGESKYRAAMLCTGEYLVEFDHDDGLHAQCLEYLYKAFNHYPDCGFAYSGCAEIDSNLKSYTYPAGFAFGYGKYREEIHFNKEMQCCVPININPATIRHIVGVPNHVRAWRRSTYLSLGGHNRKLTIADDYELLVRTFLATRFIKIDHTLYFQYMHASNTTDKRRADIQRRVRSIARHYNEDIKKRFEELGVEDWMYVPGGSTPSKECRYDAEENYVNYIYTL